MIDRQIDTYLADFLDKDYGASTFAKAVRRLGIELDPKDFRGMDFQTAEARRKKKPLAWPKDRSSTPSRRICLKRPNNRSETGKPLAKFANTRWKLNLRDRDLKKVGRDTLDEMLLEKAREAIEATDLSAGRAGAGGRLRRAFGLRMGAVQIRSAA